MADPARQSETPKKVYPVTWEGEDWDRIQEATRLWGLREHVNFTPADVIRSGTRRFVDELLTLRATVADAHQAGIKEA